MPLVEVIAAEKSDPRRVEAAAELVRGWGKVAVIARDTPGFIVNRVARGFYLEGLRLLGEGVAGIDEIDQVMKRHGGFRMGPFELMDLVGLDVNLAVSTSVWEQMGKKARFTPHPIQQRLVSAGHFGRKSGRGFYDYSREHPLPACPVDRRSFALNPKFSDALQTFAARAGATSATATEQLIFARILCAILNEAGFALAEKVASAADIDTAMIKGTNYPKGPLAWAEEIGHRTIRGMLKALNETVSDNRYAPASVFAEA
jgi:3-hydroxybutyryl-CoA dehydrogenase